MGKGVSVPPAAPWRGAQHRDAPTSTHHPTPRSYTGTQRLTQAQASLQGSLNSQPKQLPASVGQENPMGEPGVERSHQHPQRTANITAKAARL